MAQRGGRGAVRPVTTICQSTKPLRLTHHAQALRGQWLSVARSFPQDCGPTLPKNLYALWYLNEHNRSHWAERQDHTSGPQNRLFAVTCTESLLDVEEQIQLKLLRRTIQEQLQWNHADGNGVTRDRGFSNTGLGWNPGSLGCKTG